MKVSAQYAQSHLTELLASANRGEEVEIAGEGKDSYRLLFIPPADVKSAKKPILGAYEGKMKVPGYEEWKAMDKEIEEEILAKPLDFSGMR